MSTLTSLIIRVGHSAAMAAFATAAIGIVTTRWLGPSGRGSYALFVTSAGVIGTIGNMGLYQANTYYLSKSAFSSEKALGGVVLLIFCNLAALLVVCASASTLVNGLFQLVGDPGVIAALLICSLCLVMQESLGGITMALKRYAFYTDQLVLDPCLILLFTLALFYSARNESAAIGLRALGSLSAILIMLLRVARLGIRPELSLSVFKQQILFGSRSVAQNVIALLNYRVYLYFFVSDTERAGQFSAALLFCELIRFLPNTVGTALLPFLARSTPEEGGRLAAKSSRHMLAISIALVAACSAARKDIVTYVFGPAFAPIETPVIVMLAGALFNTLYQIFTRYFTSIGRQSVSVTSAAAGLVAGCIASSLLIPALGLEGAAWAYLIGSVTTSVVIGTGFARSSGLAPQKFLLLNGKDLRDLLSRHLPAQ